MPLTAVYFGSGRAQACPLGRSPVPERAARCVRPECLRGSLESGLAISGSSDGWANVELSVIVTGAVGEPCSNRCHPPASVSPSRLFKQSMRVSRTVVASGGGATRRPPAGGAAIETGARTGTCHYSAPPRGYRPTFGPSQMASGLDYRPTMLKFGARTRNLGQPRSPGRYYTVTTAPGLAVPYVRGCDALGRQDGPPFPARPLINSEGGFAARQPSRRGMR